MSSFRRRDAKTKRNRHTSKGKYDKDFTRHNERVIKNDLRRDYEERVADKYRKYDEFEEDLHS